MNIEKFIQNTENDEMKITNFLSYFINKRAMRPWIAHLRMGFFRLNSFSANGNMRFLPGGNVCWLEAFSDKANWFLTVCYKEVLIPVLLNTALNEIMCVFYTNLFGLELKPSFYVGKICSRQTIWQIFIIIK